MFKLKVFVPLSHADAVRQALGEAGAGKIGNYSFCSFSTRGTGRYLPSDKASPFVGSAGKLEQVEEEEVGVVVGEDCLRAVLAAMRKAHPYEEVAFELSELVDPSAYL